MNKNEEDKLANAIIALHQEIKGLRSDMEKHQAQTNLALGEMRTSYMKLDERVSKLDDSINGMRSDFNKYAQRNDDRANNHETRITHLESRPSIVSEPKAIYKTKKRK